MAKPVATFDCPRKAEMMMYGQPAWKWTELIEVSLDPEGHPVLTEGGEVIPPQDHWRKDGTCSYCGSMSPEALFEAIALGATVGPTDKNYKVYVEGGRMILTGGARGSIGGKFYVHHLNRENCDRLRTLIEAREVKIGYPGHFYNGIWLSRPEKPADA